MGSLQRASKYVGRQSSSAKARSKKMRGVRLPKRRTEPYRGCPWYHCTVPYGRWIVRYFLSIFFHDQNSHFSYFYVKYHTRDSVGMPDREWKTACNVWEMCDQPSSFRKGQSRTTKITHNFNFNLQNEKSQLTDTPLIWLTYYWPVTLTSSIPLSIS